MTEQKSLSYDSGNGPLVDALVKHKADLTGALALAYSPNACVFARLDETRLLDPEGTALDLDLIFEARVFSAEAELRWLQDPDGGTWVLVRESDSGRAFHESASLDYFLWGKALEDSQGGWTRLGLARVGALSVPLGQDQSLVKGQSVVLKAREYFFEDEHGNAYVGDERLLSLEVR